MSLSLSSLSCLCRHLHLCGVLCPQRGLRRGVHRHSEHNCRDQQPGERTSTRSGAPRAHHAKVSDTFEVYNYIFKKKLHSKQHLIDVISCHLEFRFVSVHHLLVPNEDGKSSQVMRFSVQHKIKCDSVWWLRLLSSLSSL